MPKVSLLALALLFTGTAHAATLQIGNGARPFAGDRSDLTTVSPNGDGRRDVARIDFESPRPGAAELEVDRADRGGLVLSRRLSYPAGASTFTWAPPRSTTSGTYVVHVRPTTGPALRAVVRVQGVDAAMGRAGYQPGALAHVAVSTDARRLRLEVFRIDAGSAHPRRGELLVGTRVAGPRVYAWAQFSDAPHDIAFRVGPWPSGVYFVRLTGADGRTGLAPFVLRPRRLGVRRVAIVMPTYTWQAYNFYDRDGDGRGDTWYAGWRSHVVRLGRPYDTGGLPRHFHRYDLPFLAWADSHLPHADYLTDADLDAMGSGVELARRYDLVIFPGHHEYVTRREYTAIEAFRDRGGNLAWLSANNFFWEVVRRGPVLRRVAQWRTLGKPEASLIGTQYRGNDEGTHRAPMQPVLGAAPWLFAGTPLSDGLPWGDFGIEIDHTAAASPSGTRVLAQVPDLYGPGLTAQMTYYETPRGAKVFAAGAFSLAAQAGDAIGSRLLDNLFARLERA